MKSKIYLFFLTAIFSLTSCGKQNIKVFVNGSEALLAHSAYLLDGVAFADTKEMVYYFGFDGEYSQDGKVCFATSNNLMIIIESENITYTLVDVDKQTSDTKTFSKKPIKTSYGIDIPIADLGSSLGYISSKTDSEIIFIK